MADKRGYSFGKYIAREVSDFEWNVHRGALKLTVDFPGSSIVFSAGEDHIYVPIKKGKMHAAETIARHIFMEYQVGYRASEHLARELLSMSDPM